MTRQYQVLVNGLVCQCANKNCLTKGFTCCCKSRRVSCAKSVPESDVFIPLGLASPIPRVCIWYFQCSEFSCFHFVFSFGSPGAAVVDSVRLIGGRQRHGRNGQSCRADKSGLGQEVSATKNSATLNVRSRCFRMIVHRQSSKFVRLSRSLIRFRQLLRHAAVAFLATLPA